MRILLLASMSNLPNVKKSLHEIEEVAEGLGHEVNADVLNSNLETFTKKAEDDFISLHKLIEDAFKSADIIIAEITKPSSGIGYMIANALGLRKPVLALYSKKTDAPAPIPLKGGKSKLLQFEEYSSDNLKTITQSFLKEAKNKLDTKFILIISPEIDRYLEWAADFKRMHKAQIVRNAVEKEMENDEDYKKYMEAKK